MVFQKVELDVEKEYEILSKEIKEGFKEKGLVDPLQETFRLKPEDE